MLSTQSYKDPIRFAMIEMNSQSDIYSNLVAIEYATDQAVTHGAKFVIVPENAFSFGNHTVASSHYAALKDWCGQLARQHNIHFVAGSLPCPFRPDGTPVSDGKFRQTSLLFDPAGECIARYDKIHLFKANITSSTGRFTQYDESKTFESGNTPVVAETALGKIGMMVCFDLRFAQMAKYLRQQGAEILTAPSAFVYETGKLHWQTLLQARALDAQCMLIGVGQMGTHYLPPDGQKNRQTWGHSQFIDANGQVMAMQILVANPFASNLANQKNVTPVATPLAKQALSWLNANSNADEQTLYLPQTVMVHLTDFDPAEQLHFRHSLTLPQSEQFGIVPPTD